jgi:hypothetical protein
MGKRRESIQRLHHQFAYNLRHHRLRYVFCHCNHTAALANSSPQPGPQTVTQVSTSAPLATSASPTPLSERRTNSGIIAGAVVGGVLGLAIIVGACWVLIHRRSKSPLPPSKLDPRFPSKLGSEHLSEAPGSRRLVAQSNPTWAFVYLEYCHHRATSSGRGPSKPLSSGLLTSGPGSSFLLIFPL